MTTAAAIGPGFFPLIGRGIGAILLYAVLGVLLMLLGFWAIDVTTPGKLNRMVRENVGETEILSVLEDLLSRYAAERRRGERLGDFVGRVSYLASASQIPGRISPII